MAIKTIIFNNTIKPEVEQFLGTQGLTPSEVAGITIHTMYGDVEANVHE